MGRGKQASQCQQDRRRRILCRFHKCGQSFATKNTEARHYNTQHLGQYPPSKQRQQCGYPGCEKMLRPCNMKNHYHTEHVGQDIRVVCEYPNCGMKVLPANLNRHYQGKHSVQLPPIECEDPECGRRFLFKSEATRHYRETHLKQKISPLRPKPCDFPGCCQTFISKAGYMMHYRFKHSSLPSSPKPFQCDFPGCNRVFSLKKKYTIHYKTKHLGHRFICDHPGCGKAYTAKANRKRHHQTEHSGQPKKVPPAQYGFPGCIKEFPTRAAYTRHYRSVHLGQPEEATSEYPVQCDFPGCEKIYTSMKPYCGHYNVKHLGHKEKARPPHVKKTIRCEHCDWNTKDRPTYLIHLLKAHNQRHLFILSPQPGMDIAESDIIPPRGVPRNMQPSYRIAKMTATTGQGSHSLSKAAKKEDQSSKIPNLDSRLRFSHGCPSLTLKGRNDIACESLTLLRDLSLC